LDDRGGILLAADPGNMEALVQEAGRFDIPFERRPGSPYADMNAAEHMRIPTDGVIDIDGLLHLFADGLREEGGNIRYGRAVQSIQPYSTGFEVITDQGVLHADILVNAAGGWVREMGNMAGGLDIPFRPLRRHLVWSAAPYPQDRSWTWWVDRPFYMRPESGGLLLCPLDEQEIPLPPRHQQPLTDNSVLDSLATSLRELSPELVERPITRLWSGLRTFAPDRRFVLGYDPVNPRLFWVAGLGGHGMTSGLAVGELAAKAILRETGTGVFDPKRFME
jgi:glycine/D-amino acid oxidase-like deaminating enzyme